MLCALLATVSVMAEDKSPAFPGAEGFGRYVTGGRGGKVLHVTNLSDSGTGSLRWALSQSGAKIIVFDVSGTIHLNSQLNIGSNVTIAGQSAPGDGICIADYPCALKGNNIIVRYMRFRLGNKHVLVNGADGWDGFGALDQNNIIVDHCSVSWSIDECLSMSGCKNITVQWCLVAQSLIHSGHTKGNHGYGGNWGGAGSSYHHNLLVHHSSRTPRLGPRPTTQLDERMDMRNNVIYNFGGNGCYGGEAMKVNIVNNYYKPGVATKSGGYQYRIAGVGIRTTEYVTEYPSYKPAWHIWGKYYVTGNVNPSYPALSASDDNQWNMGIHQQIDNSANDGTYTSVTQDTIRAREPIPFVAVTTHSAEQAYEKVLKYAGASLHRDSYDEQMVSDAANGTAKVYAKEYNKDGSLTGNNLAGGLINSQEDLKPTNAGSDWSAWPTLNSTTAPKDTDGDGMPDDWEDANGLNKNDATDGSKYAAGSTYTNVEVYLNSLVADITADQNEGGVLQGETLPGEAMPVTYTLSHETYQQTTGDAWQFEDGVTIEGGGYQGGSYNFNAFLIEKGKQYTIHIPDSISITTVTFSGYCNGTGTQTSYLSELNGTTYTAATYKFPNRNKNEMGTFRIALAKAAEKTLTFTANGQNNTCMTIKLEGVKQGSGTATNTEPGGNTGGELGTVATGTISWPFDSGSEGQTAQYSNGTTTYFTDNHIDKGSTLAYSGSKKVNDITYTKFKPSINNEATANDNNAVSFCFTLADDYYFQPTNIALAAMRFGTDGGAINISWKNEEGTTELESGIAPERDNSGGYTAYSKDVSDISAAKGTSSLVINIYKLSNAKEIGFSNIAISGNILSGTTGIHSVATGKVTKAYYTLQGTRINQAGPGISIEVTTLPDGTKQSRKVINK